MRGKGEGAVFRVPKDKTKPLKYWKGVIELPPDSNGDRRRKAICRKDKSELLREMDAFRERMKANGGDAPTRDRTVKEWMLEWFETIALKKIKPKTAATYRGLVLNHIVPRIGEHRLEKLTPRHVREMNADIEAAGLSSTTARQTHRVLAIALKYAQREGLVSRNVATLVDAPKKAVPNTGALTLEEGIAVLETAASDPLGSLWAAVLLTGARQGELLGLQLDRVSDVLDISMQLQRLPWSHGCGGACGYTQGARCPERLVVAPANWAGQHLTGGLWLAPPKTRQGTRIIPLVDPLRSIMLRHIEHTGNIPNPFNLVWRTPTGNPIEPKNESALWHDLLERAGVTDVRLHDGRHTTVDLLLEAGVPEDIIMEIVGHSARVTTRGYKTRGNRKRLTAAMQSLSDLVTLSPQDTPRETAP